MSPIGRPAGATRPILAPHARIDLRSDTVTHPSPAMRRAMADAEVGDDVFGDDPTVNALEERAAELLGKEAGLFVAQRDAWATSSPRWPTSARGQETIAGREHHIVIDEAAGHAVIVGASIRALEDRPDGTIDPAEIDDAFRDPTDPHEPITGLVTIENTHAHSMGQPLTPDYTREVGGDRPRATASRSTSMAPGSGTRSSPWASARPTSPTRPTPSRSASRRALACPVGSVVVGPRDVIWRARRARKMVGGGMRQAGVLAAAGLVALSRRPGRHDRAPRRGPRQRPPPRRGPRPAWTASSRPAGRRSRRPARSTRRACATNFVLFKVERDRAAFLAALRARDVDDGGISARAGPRRDPLRGDRRRHRDHDRRHARGARRDPHDRPATACPPATRHRSRARPRPITPADHAVTRADRRAPEVRPR